MQPPADDLPVRRARTGGFRRGQPRSVEVFGGAGGWHVRYLASSGPEDPVLALRALDHTGRHTVLAHPSDLLTDDGELPPAERVRRERLREGGSGITAFSTDTAGRRSVFPLAGQLWQVEGGREARALPTPGSVVDPRISPDGRRVAYHSGGDLRLVDSATGRDAVLCRSERPAQTWGLAEFIAAEEMGRYTGTWWSPDSDRLLVAEVDEDAVSTWWIGDPAQPEAAPRSVRYPAAGTRNAEVRLWLLDLAGHRQEVAWDRDEYPYLAAVRWDRAGALLSLQTRDQRRAAHLQLDPSDGGTRLLRVQQRAPWVELVPGSPRLTPDGELALIEVDEASDAWRLRVGEGWATPADLYVRALHRCDESGIWVSGAADPTQNHLLRVRGGQIAQVTAGERWHSILATGRTTVVAGSGDSQWQPAFVVGDGAAPLAALPNRAESPAGPPRVRFLPGRGYVRVAVLLPEVDDPAPVIVSSYGGPHAQRVIRAPLSFVAEQWLADCGYAVVVVDGRGSPGVSPSCEAAIAGDLAGPVLADQIAGLQAARSAFPGRLDTDRVGIRGWSFGGYLAALAVLRRPDVFHAAFAGAPVTEWRLYDTHYTERYLGMPDEAPQAYDRSSLLPLAGQLTRPLCLVHGMADDNVVAAHTLRLSAALTAHGRPHQVLPLPGVSHMTPQEALTEHLLRLELAFFAEHLR